MSKEKSTEDKRRKAEEKKKKEEIKHSEMIKKMLAGTIEIEFLPSGEMVRLGEGLSSKGKGVALAPHTFY